MSSSALPLSRVVVPGNHLMTQLLGQRDELLDLVESTFPDTEVHVRGNEISLAGPSAPVASRVFEEMVLLVESGTPLDSSSVVRQAMLRGNIAGTWGSWGSSLDSVDTGAHRLLLQSGYKRLPELAEVPVVFELVDRTSDPERTRRILAAWETLHEVGRPLAAPPGTNPERLAFLRDAFDKAMHDPELLEKADKLNRPFDYATGDEMKRVIRESVEMPEDLKTLFVRAVKGEL